MSQKLHLLIVDPQNDFCIADDGHGNKQMWDRIATLAPDTIVILGEFASRHNCEPEGLLQTVLAAISAKVLQPLYMLQISDEDAEEMRLTWEPRLSVFAREFSLPDGRVVDGRNPENMRVAFRRTEYVAL